MRYLLILLLLLFIGCNKPRITASPDPQTVIDLHNEIRGSDLIYDKDLEKAAQEHANWMAEHEKFSHRGKNGSSVTDRVTRSWRTIGENIAYGQRTEKSVMKDWMDSKGHRANILNENFKLIGVGIAASADGTIYWVVVFAGLIVFRRFCPIKT